jgi:hypothetical protein
MEIKDVTHCAFMSPDPKLMTVDLAKVEAFGAQVRAVRDKANPAFAGKGIEPARAEYNQLRQKLFDLKQDAKCFEIRTNEAAGRIKLLEGRINEALKLKKAASEADNFRGERTYEHQVASLETELADAQEEFNKNKHWSGQAARALKAFDAHARIEELKAVLDSPKEKQP